MLKVWLRALVIGPEFVSRRAGLRGVGAVKEDVEVASGSVAAVNVDREAHRQLLRKRPAERLGSRLLRVAILGAPNAGKSVITNALVGSAVCAVSKKVHTTRKTAIGVIVNGDSQVCVMDTPGIRMKGSAKTHGLEESLVVDPENSLAHADEILVVVDVGDLKRTRLDREILHLLYRHQPIPATLLLNKVDLLKQKSQLLSLTSRLTKGVVGGVRIEKREPRLLREETAEEKLERLRKTAIFNEGVSLAPSQTDTPSTMDTALFNRILTKPMHQVLAAEMRRCFKEEFGYPFFDAVFMISALNGDGVEELKAYLIGRARKGQWRYHESVVTDQNPHRICLNLVRAQLLNFLPQEIPYQIQLKISVWEVDEHDVLRIKVEVLCERESWVRMLLRKDGYAVGEVSREVNQQLRNIFQRDVFLRLAVGLVKKKSRQ